MKMTNGFLIIKGISERILNKNLLILTGALHFEKELTFVLSTLLSIKQQDNHSLP